MFVSLLVAMLSVCVRSLRAVQVLKKHSSNKSTLTKLKKYYEKKCLLRVFNIYISYMFVFLLTVCLRSVRVVQVKLG